MEDGNTAEADEEGDIQDDLHGNDNAENETIADENTLEKGKVNEASGASEKDDDDVTTHENDSKIERESNKSLKDD